MQDDFQSSIEMISIPGTRFSIPSTTTTIGLLILVPPDSLLPDLCDKLNRVTTPHYVDCTYFTALIRAKSSRDCDYILHLVEAPLVRPRALALGAVTAVTTSHIDHLASVLRNHDRCLVLGQRGSLTPTRPTLCSPGWQGRLPSPVGEMAAQTSEEVYEHATLPESTITTELTLIPSLERLGVGAVVVGAQDLGRIPSYPPDHPANQPHVILVKDTNHMLCRRSLASLSSSFRGGSGGCLGAVLLGKKGVDEWAVMQAVMKMTKNMEGIGVGCWQMPDNWPVFKEEPKITPVTMKTEAPSTIQIKRKNQVMQELEKQRPARNKIDMTEQDFLCDHTNPFLPCAFGGICPCNPAQPSPTPPPPVNNDPIIVYIHPPDPLKDFMTFCEARMKSSSHFSCGDTYFEAGSPCAVIEEGAPPALLIPVIATSLVTELRETGKLVFSPVNYFAAWHVGESTVKAFNSLHLPVSWRPENWPNHLG